MITAPTSTYVVRHPLPGEQLPETIWPKLQSHIDPDWLWLVVDDQEQVQIALLTAPIHGIVFLVQLWSASTAPRYLLRRLLRVAAQEVSQRGFKAWMVMLGANRPDELRLARIALRFQALPTAFTGFTYVGGLSLCL